VSESCTPNGPPPEGFRVWRSKAVPKELESWAIELRDRWMPGANYGDTVGRWYTPADSHTQRMVIARKDHHTWTYHKSGLVTGICIPGMTLYESLLTPALAGVAAVTTTSDDDTPDPSAARYSQDLGTDWGLVGWTVAATAAVVTAFLVGLRAAGR
jgi:hypothetical protein